MNRFLAATCVLVASSLGLSSAQAATVTLTNTDMPNSEFVSAQLNDAQVETQGDNTFRAGSFTMEEAVPGGVAEFIAWCLEIDVVIADGPATYNTGVTLLSAERETLLSKLFTGYVAQTQTDVGAAAFQLAIWEIVEESSITDFDVTMGVFMAQSAADGVIETANAFLAGLGDFDANFRINYFQNPDGPDGPGTQDLISAAPVPLPASAVLLIAGLGGLAFMRSRKRS